MPPAGRPFLQIPGPTNVPASVLAAIARPTIDHRGPEFAALTLELLPALARVFRTSGPVVVYPGSGTGAWEAALVNTLSPGDTVLASDSGHFATLWSALATRLGLRVELLPGDWRHGVDPEAVHHRLVGDPSIKAVMVVHNETSTGVTSRVADVRVAIDAADHSALLLVDTISSLASIDYRHDEWGGSCGPPSRRPPAATRAAVWGWGLEVLCADEPRVFRTCSPRCWFPTASTRTRYGARSSSVSACRSAVGSGGRAGRVFRDRPPRRLQRPHAGRDARGRRTRAGTQRRGHRARRDVGRARAARSRLRHCLSESARRRQGRAARSASCRGRSANRAGRRMPDRAHGVHEQLAVARERRVVEPGDRS